MITPVMCMEEVALLTGRRLLRSPGGVRALSMAILVALVLVDAARADPSDRRRETPEERARWDYSRFSDGPRRVPRPRGASRRRAERLGLGTREAARRAMRGAAPRGWTDAARGPAPQTLLWPVDAGRFMRGFGYVRPHRPDLRHNGLDIGAEAGTPVRAAAPGIVVYSDNGLRGFGNCVVLLHRNGWVSVYAHNRRTTVQPGWRVRRGERIALVGSTGISHGPHLHFELWHEGRALDPLSLFDGGPRRVRRAGTAAARRGERPDPVPDPDYPDLTPLRPHSEDAPGPPDPSERLPSLARLLHRPPPPPLLARVAGRRFSTLLWPVRGGAPAAETPRGRLRIEAAADSGVRAAADGLVVFAGPREGHGTTVALLHVDGSLTVYGGLGRVAVEAGTSVERGTWIGRTGGGPLVLELREEGRRAPITPRLVGQPQ
jgi:murein DD-endopeptidase MepM/ murein hydrolase activator NlpD